MEQVNDPNVQRYNSHLILRYNSHLISLKSNWEFAVTGPEFDDAKYVISFKSLTDAKSEIDKRVSETQKLAAKNVSFSALVLDANGTPKRIEKIDRRTSEVLNIETRSFYPNIEWIKEALQRRTQLVSTIKTIDDALKDFQLSKTVGYGRIDAENYAQKVQSLKNDLKEKTAQAQQYKKIEPVPQVQKPQSIT